MGEWFFEDYHDKLADLLRDKAPITMPEYVNRLHSTPNSCTQYATSV